VTWHCNCRENFPSIKFVENRAADFPRLTTLFCGNKPNRCRIILAGSLPRVLRFATCCGLFLEKAVNARFLFACSALLLLASSAYGSGPYQRTEDGETLVWNNYSKSGDEATWSGDRDANGYATGYGTLTWYRVERKVIVGSSIPTVKRTLVARYLGNMTRGKLDGPVSADANGEILHAKFVDGSIAGSWIAGPAPGRNEKWNERLQRGAVVEAPAEGPRRAADQPLDQDLRGGAIVETPTLAGDSLRLLTAPPSSLRMGIVGEASPSKPSAPLNLGADTNDAKTVAALDTRYQAAVKANDAATMDGILADDFVLVTGHGGASTKADLIKQAQEKRTIYEHQEEEEGTQKVRVWGDAAVVTAQLWIKGTEQGTPLDYRLWFSDTYVRTPLGWRYVFGQASIPLPITGAQ
jgi:ketosteroid isomerase-like protein